MSLTQIQADLTRARVGDRITLAGPVSPGLIDVLAPLGLTSLEVDGIAIDLAGDAVILTGRATFRGQTWTTRLSGEADGELSLFSLRLTRADSPLTFTELLGTLPPTRRADPSGSLVLMPSVIGPLTVADAAFVVPARVGGVAPVVATFQGWLSLTQGLERYARFLNADGRLWLDGSIDFRASPPALALDAMAPRAPADIPLAPLGRIGLHLSDTARDDWAVGDDPPPPPLSMIELVAQSPVGDAQPPVLANVRTPLFMNDSLWPLTFSFADYGQPLTGGIGQIISMFGGDAPGFDALLSRPTGFELLDNFYISSIEVGIDPALDGGLPSANYLAITLQSHRPWNPPIPFVQVKNTGTRWLITWHDGYPVITGSVWGTLAFGPRSVGAAATRARVPLGPPELPVESAFAGKTWDLDVVAALPQFDVWVSSAGSVEIPFADGFAYFFTTPSGVTASLTISQIDMFVSPSSKIFNGYLLVEGNWPIAVNNITFNLDSIALAVNVTENEVSGSLEGRASIVVASAGGQQTKAVFFVNAEYPGGGDWIFSGGLAEGTLNVRDFVVALLGLPDPPAWVPAVILDRLLLTYDTGEGTPYSAEGHLTVQWDVGDALGFPLALEAGARIARVKAAQASRDDLAAAGGSPVDNDAMVTQGALSGSFTINQVKVSAGLSFKGVAKIYFFRVDWNGAAIEATTVQVTTPRSGPHNALRISLQGLTLGGVVERLVNLVNPNLNYHLEVPWDFLNAIDLSRFSLILDAKDNTIELSFRVDLETGFMRIDSVGVVYDRSNGAGTVSFKLLGRLLDKTYTNDAPLTWDAIDDAPPEVPGGGVQLIELRYLGLGQHVTLTPMPDSIGAIIARLREDMRPPKGPGGNPLTGATGLRFAPESQWMIGLDVSVMETLSLGLVFNDPKLYGLVVALAGPKSGSLSGLSFELLYQKVSDDVGVFRIRLQVPDAFRQLDFGAVSITLGIISVDIYTNGNFMVDLGFPHDRVFDTSFGVSVGPFMGRGGIYFGLLDGATSRRVPLITNGRFSPVIELGVGLAVGLGRTFNKGPLKAGLYVELEVILQGVLAWFHPNDAAADTTLYYWCRGTAAIVGKLYGKVDFKIISASVSVEAYASVTLTLECYQVAVVELDVGVDVRAEVEFLFFSVSFSFSMRLQTSFTIGESSTPPWILAADQGGRDPRRLVGSLAAPRRRRHAELVDLTRAGFRRAHAARLREARHDDLRDEPRDDVDVALNWRPDQSLFADGRPRTVAIKVLPVFAVDAVPVAWSGPPPVNPAPAYRVAFVLMADAPAAHPAGAVDTSFNALVETMLRWSISSLGITPFGSSLSAGALAELAAQMESAATAQDGFGLAVLDTLFGKNLKLVIRPQPAAVNAAGGVAFAMVPYLSWTSDDLPDPDARSRDFLSYQMVDGTYEAMLGAYFRSIEPGHPASAADVDLAQAPESMASFVFRDYFLLIAKTAVQHATDLMHSWPVAADAGESLGHVAGRFQTATQPYVKVQDDTLDRVAAQFGFSAAELEFLKPGIAAQLHAAPVGATIDLILGVTPQALASANPDTALLTKTIGLGPMSHQLRGNETLGAVADRFGCPLTIWLADADLLQQVRLLSPGSALSIPASYRYANPNGLSVDVMAAVFFLRLHRPAEVALRDWYAQAIIDLNPGKIASNPDGTPLPLPDTLLVPKAYDDIVAPLTWRTLLGDTLEDIAAVFALLQAAAPLPAFADFARRMRLANPEPGTAPIVLPPDSATTIAPADTLARLADRLLATPTAPIFAAMVGPAAILAPLQTVLLPNTRIAVTAGQTLAELAARYAIGIDDLGGRLASESDLLAAGTALSVPQLVSVAVDDLVDQLMKGATPGTISGLVSRFMLHGLRMPAPYQEAGIVPLKGLYELVGQQVKGMAPGDCDPATTSFTVTFHRPLASDKDWIDLGPPPLPPVPPGLAVAVSAADLCDYTPATSLTPEFLTPPAPLRLWREQPMRWPLQQRLLWQAPGVIPLPTPDSGAPVNGMPALWPLPDDLRVRGAAQAATPYVLKTLDPLLGPGASAVDVRTWGWACLLALRLRTVPGRPSTYEMFGADTAGRQLLLDLWRHLEHHSADPATLNLLYQPSPSTNLPTGLASQTLVAGSTYLVKTNLTTETHSGRLRLARQADEPANQGLFFATLDQGSPFLTLLWECSVVGGGGYWLQVTDSEGRGLPDALFDANGMGQVSILVTLASQTTVAPLSRRLWSFNNCALMRDNLDPSAIQLFAESGDGSVVTRLPTVEPGNVGIDFTLRRPPPPDVAHPRADALPRLRRYYQLLGYRLLTTDVIDGSHAAMPIGPQMPQRAPGQAPADDMVWRMSQVIPAAHLALAHPLPGMVGLPPPADDPYAGIRLVGPASERSLGSARVQFWFQDMFGNATAGAPIDADRIVPAPASAMPDEVAVPVGYTDALIGVVNWPCMSTSFRVTAAASGPGAILQVTLGFQPAACVPTLGQSGDVAAQAAADLRGRYERIYYQVMQDDIEVHLQTTLQQARSAAPADLPVRREAVRALAAGTHAFLGAASALAAVPADLAVCGSLQDVADRYGVGIDDIAAANTARKVSAILARPASRPWLKMPQFAVLRAGDTVELRCPDDPVGVLTAAENTRLPLHAGVELVIDRRTATTPVDPTTIAALAATAGCSTASLVAANAGQAPLLRLGFVFDMGGRSVAVASAETTLDDVARTFRDNGVQVDALMIGAAYTEVPGVFDTAKSYGVDRWTIQEHETLLENGSGDPLARLARNNIKTADLFHAGTALYSKTIDGSAAFDDTIAAAALTYGITARQLLEHNAAAALSNTATLIVPGQSQMLAAPATMRIPYTCQTTDTLAALAARFVALDAADPVLALAATNAVWPDLVAGGKVVQVGTQHVETVAGDSLDAVVRRFDPAVTLAQVVAVIAGVPGYLAQGALLLCPPAELDAAAPVSPLQVAQVYGVDPVALATANAGLVRVIAADKTLRLKRGDHVVAVSTGPSDHGVTRYTFNSLVRRFSEQGVETTIEEIVRANADVDCLAAGAMLLLPPRPAVVGTPFGTTGWSVPDAIFPVHAWLDLRRDPTLVLPEFRGTVDRPGEAVSCRSPVSPFASESSPSPGDTRNGPLRLQGFAAGLEAAMPSFRVGSGKVRRAGDDSTAAGRSDVWAVAFGPGFIEKVDIQAPRVDDTPTPRFFALQPLFNHLVTRSGVTIQHLADDGTLGAGKISDFQGIDLDTWAANFLGDVDLFLSAPYATPACRLAGGDALQDILDTKALLALAVANGLDDVLSLGQPAPTTLPPDWVAARDMLKQQMLTNLGRAWTTDVIVQYNVSTTVAAPWAPLQARLSGSAVLHDTPEGRDAKRVNVTGAKASLATAGSYLTFAATLQRDKTVAADTPPEEAQQSFLALDLGYDINELEFDIRAEAAGYESSNWLSFVRPPTEAGVPPGWRIAMGATRAPVPLRAYPSPATLVGHTAGPTYAGTADWRQTVFWTYGSTFRHRSAAQDQIRFEVEFNQPTTTDVEALQVPDDLFAALAQYDAIRPRLWEFFKQLPMLDQIVDRTPLESAMSVFADLIRTRIRPLWALHWNIPDRPAWARSASATALPATPQSRPVKETYRYLSTPVPERVQGRDRYVALLLEREAAGGSLSWPTITVVAPDGSRYELKPRAVHADDPGTTSQYYDFPPDSQVLVGTQLDYVIEFARLHVAHYENATTQVSVLRNARLLGPTGPKTRDGFIYLTPPVAFPDLATPTLTWDDRFPLNDWDDLGTPLNDVFKAMVDNDVSGDRTTAVAASYGFELVPGAIVTTLPVLYRPRFAYTGVQASEVAARVKQWQRDNNPAKLGGEWVFGVTLFATLDPARQSPLFELRNVSSRLPVRSTPSS